MPRENIKYELRAVDDPALRGFFDVPLLHGRQVAVEDDQRGFVSRGFRANFIQLAASH